MKCKNCNYDNSETAKFCSGCGQPLTGTDSVNNNSIENQSVVISSYNKGKKPKSKKKIAAVIAVVAVVIVAIIAFLSTRCNHEFGDVKCGEIPVCVLCSEPVGSPLEHDWKEATCTDPKTCNRCGKTEGDALGHDWEEATCQKPKTCKRCELTKGDTIAHQSDSWKVIKKATCTEEGQEEGYCNLCNHTVTQTIPKIDHKPGKWKTTKQATIQSDGKREKRCTVCNEVVKEETVKITKDEYKNECKTYSYSTIARNPNKYKGEYGKFSGKVIQVIEDDLYSIAVSYTLRVALNGDYNNVILVTYVANSDDDHILEDDRINLYGEIQGSYTYESTMGASITVPYVEAKYIDIL